MAERSARRGRLDGGGVTGDFAGGPNSDILFQNSTTGELSVWQMFGTRSPGPTTCRIPAAAGRSVATGDFNSDGSDGILFRDDAGDLAIWDVKNNQIVGSGSLGDPLPGWTFSAAGDYDGGGHEGLLFENAGAPTLSGTLTTTRSRLQARSIPLQHFPTDTRLFTGRAISTATARGPIG